MSKYNLPTKAQEEYAKKIAAALKIPLPSVKTKQSYWEFINANSEAAKKAPATYEVNGSRGRGEIVLSFDRIPNHCGDCSLYTNSAMYDENAFFGDGLTQCCPFGASTFRCLIVRPSDCPIRVVGQRAQ